MIVRVKRGQACPWGRRILNARPQVDELCCIEKYASSGGGNANEEEEDMPPEICSGWLSVDQRPVSSLARKPREHGKAGKGRGKEEGNGNPISLDFLVFSACAPLKLALPLDRKLDCAPRNQ